MAQEIAVDIHVDQVVLDRVFDDLKIQHRPSIIVNFDSRAEGKGGALKTTQAHRKKIAESGSDLYGRYKPAENVILVANRTRSFAYQSVAFITHQIRWTLLHELRHRWQDENWSEREKLQNRQGKYDERLEEIDANDFAAREAFKYPGLVTVATNRRNPRLP